MSIQPNRFMDPFSNLFSQIDSIGQMAARLSGNSFVGGNSFTPQSQFQPSMSFNNLFGFSSAFSPFSSATGGAPLMGGMQDLTQLMGTIGNQMVSGQGQGLSLPGLPDLFGGLQSSSLFGNNAQVNGVQTMSVSTAPPVIDSPQSGLSQDELRFIDGADGRLDGKVDIMLEDGRRITKKGTQKLGGDLKNQINGMTLSDEEKDRLRADVDRDMAVLNKVQKLLKKTDKNELNLNELDGGGADYIAKPVREFMGNG